MYVYCRLLPVLVERSPTRQCVIASVSWVSEMIQATAWVWETIADNHKTGKHQIHEDALSNIQVC